MSTKAPTVLAHSSANNEELLQVSGVGPRAVSRYGAGILKVLERV